MVYLGMISRKIPPGQSQVEDSWVVSLARCNLSRFMDGASSVMFWQ